MIARKSLRFAALLLVVEPEDHAVTAQSTVTAAALPSATVARGSATPALKLAATAEPSGAATITPQPPDTLTPPTFTNTPRPLPTQVRWAAAASPPIVVESEIFFR